MLDYKFEHEDNLGLLYLTTYLGTSHQITCRKKDHQTFRVGGTGATNICVLTGEILEIRGLDAKFRVFGSGREGWACVSDDSVVLGDHTYIQEFFSLYMERKDPGWILLRKPIADQVIFVNVDILDGGGNIITRYRISPFFGGYRIMHNKQGVLE